MNEPSIVDMRGMQDVWTGRRVHRRDNRMHYVLFDPGTYDWGGWFWPGVSGGFGWSWLWLIWLVVALLFWAGLIALVIWAIRSTIALRRDSTMTSGTAMEILRRRLAAGEITPEEFDRIRQLLED